MEEEWIGKGHGGRNGGEAVLSQCCIITASQSCHKSPLPPTRTQPSLAHLLLMTAESPSPLTAEYDYKTVQWRKRNSSSSTDGTIKPGVRWQQEGH